MSVSVVPENLFLSREWFREVAEAVESARRQDPHLRRLTETFSLSFAWRVRGLPAGLRDHFGGRDEAVIFVRISKGVLRRLEVAEPDSEEKVQVVLTSRYDEAKRLFTGSTTPACSFLRRRLRVEASPGFSQWPRYVPRSVLLANMILKLARQVPSAMV